ncbi:hypothetical protein JXM83_01550 [Candidatus Woesearchaeota archaeon]|nr:hypothetical protein [Candidatus Woesearchaeota archaeon]
MIEAKPLDIQEELNRSAQPESLLDRCFFGKNTVLKIQLTKKITEYNCYIHVGKVEENTWKWTRIKLNDLELAEIVDFINSDKKTISFFHKFKETSKSIHINKIEKGSMVKIDNISKFMVDSELRILEILLKKIIEIRNFNT